MNICTRKLSRFVQAITTIRQSRQLNCWTAAIAKPHRKIYEKTYPTVLVNPDGSSINIRYHEPRGIIHLPLDVTKLSDEEKKLRLERRKPKTIVKIVEEFDDSFDATKYLRMKKK